MPSRGKTALHAYLPPKIHPRRRRVKLELTYRQIFHISAPIMLGSAAQNVIALSDSVLLYHKGETDFAAIGFVGVFYIAIAAIGWGFSRGGQIMIARRMGEQNMAAVGSTFHAMLYFELGLAALMFAFMKLAAPWLFALSLDHSPEVLRKSLEYLERRSYGVFFSYAGMAVIALYTGMARTAFILVDTVILAVVNLALNYSLIFGKFGLPEMGIAGSGLASTIAEVVAFVIFIGYMALDYDARRARIFHFELPNFSLIKRQLDLSLPVVAQTALGQGSWVMFFAMVENLGERPLAVSNLARTVFLCLSIPAWGFASGVNTLVSNLLGQGKKELVVLAALKTSWACWLTTMAVALPVVFFPETILYPLFGRSDMDTSLIREAQPIFYILLGILTLFSFGGVFVNAVSGTGATATGLKMQTAVISIYLGYIFWVTHFTTLPLTYVWLAEVIYWSTMLGLVGWYLRSGRWHGMEV